MHSVTRIAKNSFLFALLYSMQQHDTHFKKARSCFQRVHNAWPHDLTSVSQTRLELNSPHKNNINYISPPILTTTKKRKAIASSKNKHNDVRGPTRGDGDKGCGFKHHTQQKSERATTRCHDRYSIKQYELHTDVL